MILNERQDTHMLEVELKKAIIKRSIEAISVVDGSKFNHVGLASFPFPERINPIVTDVSAPRETVKCFAEKRQIDFLISQTQSRQDKV